MESKHIEITYKIGILRSEFNYCNLMIDFTLMNAKKMTKHIVYFFLKKLIISWQS